MERIPCLWIGIFNIVKMSIFSKVIYLFKAILTKIPIVFFAEIEKPILNFIWYLKGPQIVKTILKKNKAAGLIPPDFKTY